MLSLKLDGFGLAQLQITHARRTHKMLSYSCILPSSRIQTPLPILGRTGLHDHNIVIVSQDGTRIDHIVGQMMNVV
jgi:hypothetical protein